jgi:small ligand-binding sensory domain FIST
VTDSTKFLVAHATAPEWRDAAAKLALDLSPIEAAHRLGFLYVTDNYADALGDIAVFLKQATGVPHWVGTVGFGVCATRHEYFDEPAMAALVAPIPEDAFRLFTGGEDGTAPSLGDLAEWSGDTPPLAVVHGDPRSGELPELIEELAAATNGFLVGGLSASRGAHPQVAEAGVREGGMSGVLLSIGAVPLATALTQGCSPIGPAHVMTQAEDNVIFEIDDRPALDVFKEDIGEVLARDLSRVEGYIFAALPVQGSDTGDYLVRNLVGIDPEHGAIAIGDNVEPGGQVMFCRRDRDSAVEDMRRMLGGLKARAGNSPIRGRLYFSCCARGPNQFGDDSRELGLIAEELGDFPLVGFFANGEISHDRLYGYTGVLTLFL